MPTSALTLDWDAPALGGPLGALLPGLRVEVRSCTTSTNSVILEDARAAPQQPAYAPDSALSMVRRSVESTAFHRGSVDVQPRLLVAEQQTGGRGRQGRSWQSAPGASLTFSLALPLQVADWSGLSLAVGVAVAEALDPCAAAPQRDPRSPHIALKWPNDLLLVDGAGGGRKLGGILIETLAAGPCRLAVIGIGLNVKALEINDASSGFACLQELDVAATAPGALHLIALPLVQALQQFERDGFGAFATRFATRDLLRGRPVRTTQPDVPEGIAQGVSAQGALLVRTDQGIRPVSSGEVSVRLNMPLEEALAQRPC